MVIIPGRTAADLEVDVKTSIVHHDPSCSELFETSPWRPLSELSFYSCNKLLLQSLSGSLKKAAACSLGHLLHGMVCSTDT